MHDSARGRGHVPEPEELKRNLMLQVEAGFRCLKQMLHALTIIPDALAAYN